MTTLARRKKSPSSDLAAVAARAGVSIATVSRVVNGAADKVAEKTADRVRKAVKELDYRPQSAGRALRSGTTRIIAVLVANLGNPIMAAIASSIEDALRREGYVMLLCDTHEKSEIQDEYLREMQALRVCAIVMAVAVPSARLDELRERGVPLVFVNRRDPVPSRFPYVGIDNRTAGQDVARHCLARGWRDLAVIHPSLAYSAQRERLEGFITGLAEAGLPEAQIRRYSCSGIDHLQIGQQAMTAMLADRPLPQALVCLSDPLAYGAYFAVTKAGLRIPQDLKMIGFDDGPLNHWIAQWLSAVRIPYELIGDAVYEAVYRQLIGEASPDQTIPHELIIRDR
ncbi:PurR Transcriptional regulators [Rhabdaerophilaceae bacterium]